ncbi:MAG TPA: hypothetical protein VHB77_16045 [Planctomycetaceae bacterium]|nr:hypothetical protein [Planctomycetaceae bacterium]
MGNLEDNADPLNDAKRQPADNLRQANADRDETLAAIRAGLADAEAGRVKPAREALEALAKKYLSK